MRAAGTGSPRTAWHVQVNAVVLVYLLLSLVALVAGGGGGGGDLPHWLAVHLLLLGAATNAIVIWGEHFGSALLRAPVPDRRRSAARLAALNAGVTGVLCGVASGWPVVTVLAASAVALAVGSYLVGLGRMARRALAGRFAGTVHYYRAAGIALLAGVVLGVILALPGADSDGSQALRAAHVHLNVLGWIALTVLGTLFTLWPTVLRTRMVDGVMRGASRGLVLLCTGLLVTATSFTVAAFTSTAHLGTALTATAPGADQAGVHGFGPAGAWRWLSVAGLAVYASGVGTAVHPLLRTWRRKPPRDLAAWSLAAAVAWLVVWLGADAAALAVAPDPTGYDQDLDALVPVLLVGFVVQVLIGALTFLLPVVLGGGPRRVRVAIGSLSRAWRARVVALNAGVGLLALPVIGVLVHVAGRPSSPAVVSSGSAVRTGWLLVVAATGAGLVPMALLLVGARPGKRNPPAGEK